MLSKVNAGLLGAGTLVAAFFVTAASSLAAGVYSISPVTTGVTSEISADLLVILPILGALIALGVMIHFVRRHAKPS
jgi:hypothetical protein